MLCFNSLIGCLKKLILYSTGNNNSHYLYFLSLFLKRNRLSFNQLFAQKRANLYLVIQVLWKRLPRSEARKSYNFNDRSLKDCSLVTFPSRSDDIHEILQFPACMRTHLQHVRKSQRRLPSRYSSASTQHLFFCIASVA
jgi:hypothetical protein